MGFLEKFRQIFSSRTDKSGTPIFVVNTASYGPVSAQLAMQLSVVYRCVDLISNGLAQLPISILDEEKRPTDRNLSYVLNRRPNHLIDHYTFMKLLVASVLLRGNGYAIIERDGDGVRELHFVDPDMVSIAKAIDKEGLVREVVYLINGVQYLSDQILHVKNFSYDGIVGVSTIAHAVQSLNIAFDSEATASGFFKYGGNVGGILSSPGIIAKEQKEKIRDAWTSAFSAETGKPNSVAVLDGGMSYQSIKVSPADAQLLESRQYNAIDIARFFSVSPTKIFDLSKSSYSTIEAENLAFLSETLQPLLARFESEFRAKLLSPEEQRDLSITFDTTSILRTDKQSLASYYSTLFNIGVLSQNEIRHQLDLAPIQGGDEHFIQVNLTTPENILNQNQNEGEGNNEQ